MFIICCTSCVATVTFSLDCQAVKSECMVLNKLSYIVTNDIPFSFEFFHDQMQYNYCRKGGYNSHILHTWKLAIFGEH